ncbi:PREDICTED: centromere protein J [Habropoda laboriosa]|uniref:centromere protein J n=1 Tax=Habropoda laboriosa TaxID=597456 RepID=UPI00083DBEF2|nr:PREDICTED: centromere protein J [Habropoda laboriosa]
MDLEATVVERLQKLRQWQLEQQERLLKQQQVQREMLTQRQDCIYKALELSIQELDLNEDHMISVNDSNETIANTETDEKNIVIMHNELEMRESCAQISNSNKSYLNQNSSSFEEETSQQQFCGEKLFEDAVNTKTHIKIQSKDKAVPQIKNDIKVMISSPEKEKQVKQFIIDGIAPLPSNKTVINHISIDDIPIPSPRKDFHTLLEERLKDCENEHSKKSNINLGNKVKKPFLRKGEGLSRFKLNQQPQPTILKTRPRSASFTNNTQSGFKYKNESKSNKTTRSSKNVQLSKSTHSTNVPQKHLCLKNIPLPKKKVRSKSESNTSQLKDYVNEVKNTVELNTSDFHSGTQKELEEVRIFELLEEKAENSSFCSTSSAVVAFLHQSTPCKVKNAGCKTESGMLNAKQITPIIKTPKDQLILKSNQVYKCATSNKNADIYCNIAPIMNQKVIQNSVHKGTMNTNENNITKENDNRHTLFNQIQSIYNQQNFYNIPDVENDNEVDVSLHVRFSEYNEYKTIGLTDTSSISTESLAVKTFSDEKVWSDSSTPETSTIETSSMPFKIPQSPMIIKVLNYKTQCHKSNRQNNNSNCNVDIHQYICHKDESEFSDTADQFPDDKKSILHNYSQNHSSPQKIDNFHSIEASINHMDKCDNKKADECVNSNDDEVATEDQENKENLQEASETIFKSELLKNRLLELEQEINIFRKENTSLSIQRKKIQEDSRNLHKEYTEKEKKLEENRKLVEDRLQEEKKKLIREKAALESRMRDSQEKVQQSKLERQEMQNLKQELEQLKEETHIKESRWNAAQSRHKCQMRILKMENSKLKQEIEKLQNLKKSNIRNKEKSGTSSNTRAIHQINKQINMQFKESHKINGVSSEDDQKLIETAMKTANIINSQYIEEGKEHNYNSNKSVINEKSQTTIVNLAKKRNLYENLIKEATSDLTEIQEQFDTSKNLNESSSDLSSKLKQLESKTNIIKDNCEKSYKESDISFNHDNINSNIQLHMQNDYTHFISPTKTYHENHDKSVISKLYDELSSTHVGSKSSCQSKLSIDKQGIKQIQHIDGSIEYHFPNGNVKKVFPDQGLTKLIYYNGDVRETNRDGKIKYFYASTGTWHTTMPDGLEILKFANGQVERRLHNGAVEVSFPDGSLRILESGGIEKWIQPDGTLIQILTNGEKILTLPNGQREIHTKTHKRREYPDGTMKLIYLDGTQETRYSNGRIRIKDKDGNLLMDSYQ